MNIDNWYDAEVTTDKMKVTVFPVVVQAMYNSLVAMSSICYGDFRLADGENKAVLRDLRNVNKMLHSIGVDPTYPKRMNDDGAVTLKHINTTVLDGITDEFSEQVRANRLKMLTDLDDHRTETIEKLKRKIFDLEFRNHMLKKYGTEDKNDIQKEAGERKADEGSCAGVDK